MVLCSPAVGTHATASTPQPASVMLCRAVTCHAVSCCPALQMSVDAMLAQCASPEHMNATLANAVFFKNLAKQWNLNLTTYEAGPSIMENSVIFNGGGTPGAADK